MRTPLMRLLPRPIWPMLWLCIAAGNAAAGSIDSEVLALSIPESARITAVVENDIAQLEARLLVSNDPTPRIGVLGHEGPEYSSGRHRGKSCPTAH